MFKQYHFAHTEPRKGEELPFRAIEVGDRVICKDETYTDGYSATVIKIRKVKTAKFVLRFDDGKNVEYDDADDDDADGNFNRNTYGKGKEWWFIGYNVLPALDMEFLSSFVGVPVETSKNEQTEQKNSNIPRIFSYFGVSVDVPQEKPKKGSGRIGQ